MVNQTIRLDFQTGAVQPRLHASQFDAGERVFTIECFFGRTPYVFPAGSTVIMSGRKPGNTTFLRSARLIRDNVAIFDCVRTMTDVDGHVKCELIVTTPDGTNSSANFVLLVETSVIKTEEMPESDYQAIQDLVDEAKQATAGKQDKLTAGRNITIVQDPATGNTVISATGGGGGETYYAGRGINITSANEIETDFDPNDKQDKLTAGDNITIDANGVISATSGKTYTAGENVQISATDVISATDTKYTAGTNVTIDANNVISSEDTTYTAGDNVTIDSNNIISAEDTTYTAGDNVHISAANVISADDTTYTAGDNVTIDANNVISAEDTTYTAGDNVQISNANVISATDTTYAAGTGVTITGANNAINAERNPDNTYTKTEVETKLAEQQKKLTPGTNVQISNTNVISATDTTYAAGTGITITGANNTIAAERNPDNTYTKTETDTELAKKQDKLVASTNIQIAADGKTISATDTTYTAGTGIAITGANNTIAAERNPTNTYTKTEVDTLIANLSHGSFKKVDTLPATGEAGYIYLVPKISGGYEQYIWGDDGGMMKWIDIGGEDIDLSGYVTDTELATELADYITAADATTELNKKQDKLVASTNIQIAADGKTISATDTTYTAGTGITITGANNTIAAEMTPSNTYTKTETDTELAKKQDKLVAGTNVQIAADGKTISATDTTYTAGDGMILTGTEFKADILNGISQTATGKKSLDAVQANPNVAGTLASRVAWLEGLKEIPSGANFNTILTIGEYYISNTDFGTATNKPPCIYGGRLTVENSVNTNDNHRRQTYFECMTGNTFVRITADGGTTWTAWNRLIGDTELPAYLVGKIAIPANTDLNDVIDPGEYYVVNAVSASLSNAPITGDYRLTVENAMAEGTPYRVQRLKNYRQEWVRYRFANGTWTDWRKDITTVEGKTLFAQTLLASGDDLNTFVTPVETYSSATAITNSLVNCPITGTPVRLTVESVGVFTQAKPNYIRQTIWAIGVNDPTLMYTRTTRNASEATPTWSPWQKVVLSNGEARLANVENFGKITNFTNTLPAVDVPSGAWTKLAEITLEKGTYLVCSYCEYQANATGRRYLKLSDSDNPTALSFGHDAQGTAVTGDMTRLQSVRGWASENNPVTIRLYGWQNSGSTLKCTPSYIIFRTNQKL